MLRLLLPMMLVACQPTATDSGERDGPGPAPAELQDLLAGPANLDFGEVFVGDAASDTFGVLNRERDPVEITTTLEVSRPDGFALEPGSATIEPGEYATFEVTVSPDEWDDYSGRVAVTDAWGREVGAVGLTVRVRIDDDGDGYGSDRFSGDDCDDDDPTVHPGADDAWYDGVDQDCDGASDFDQDRDGDDSAAHGGGDCDDLDPTRSSLADEVWYDGVDQDCDDNDDDQDLDGYTVEEDCDDTDPDVYPGGGGFDDDCNELEESTSGLSADSGLGGDALSGASGGGGAVCGGTKSSAGLGFLALLTLGLGGLRRRRD